MTAPATPSTGSDRPVREGADYRLLFSKCPDALLVIQPNLRVCLGNQAAEHLSGLSATELEGNTLADMVDPSEREILLSFIIQTQRDDASPGARHFRFFNKSGVAKTIEVHARNLESAEERQRILLS